MADNTCFVLEESQVLRKTDSSFCPTEMYCFAATVACMLAQGDVGCMGSDFGAGR
jgi:hypothetical protein